MEKTIKPKFIMAAPECIIILRQIKLCVILALLILTEVFSELPTFAPEAIIFLKTPYPEEGKH